MRNVLFIVFEFPPVHTTGGIRPLKFAKYLPGFGFNPVIIAPDIDSGKRAFPHAKMDDSLLKELEGIEIHRVPVEDFSRIYSNKWLNILYHYFPFRELVTKHWQSNVDREVEKIMKSRKIEAMYVCCPPFGVAPLGNYLSDKYGLPWLLDMRDHWSLWSTGAYISRLHYKLSFYKEKKAFRSAGIVSSVTAQVISDFKHDHPEFPDKKWRLIPNGFEAELLDDRPLEVNLSAAAQIRIGYMGEFYYSPAAHETMFTPWYKKKWNRFFQYSPRKEDYRYRSPYYFFSSLSRYFELYPEMKKKVFFHYVGNIHDWLKEMIREFALEENCVLHGKVNYTESLRISKEFDICLSTASKVIGGEDYCLASKTFDYLMLRKPILGFVSRGSHREFLKSSGIAFLCDPDDREAAVKIMHRLFNSPLALNYNKDYLKNYSRRENARKLSAALNDLIVQAK